MQSDSPCPWYDDNNNDNDDDGNQRTHVHHRNVNVVDCLTTHEGIERRRDPLFAVRSKRKKGEEKEEEGQEKINGVKWKKK